MHPLTLITHFAATTCQQTFLGFRPWNYYLQMDPTKGCAVTSSFHLLGADSSLLLIALAVIDDLFRAVGLLAVIFVIVGGVRYILSQGNPSETQAAWMSILNAMVGMAISFVAIAIVSFIGAQAGNTNAPAGSASGLDLSGLPNTAGAASGSIIPTALGIVFGIIGSVAMLIIVIAGFQYVTSAGDPQTTTRSKNAIVYALIGLVVAILAESFVSFIVNTYHQ